MAMKKAKMLEDQDLEKVLGYLSSNSDDPIKDKLTVLFTVKAGLRAAEVAGLRWDHVTKADGTLSDFINLSSDITKGGRERCVPMHPDIKNLLTTYQVGHPESLDLGVRTKRKKNPAHALVMWFSRLYRRAGLYGCSSHSGRRTFITKLSRSIEKHNCSLFDVQRLAGHASITTTQFYVEPQKRVSALVSSV